MLTFKSTTSIIYCFICISICEYRKAKALKEEFIKIYNFNAAADTIKEQEHTDKSMTDDPTDEAEEGKKCYLKLLNWMN